MDVLIAGTRGIPAAHGGFETFAQDLASYLVSRGHNVTVYCQEEAGSLAHEDIWHGVHRVHIPAINGPIGTMLFDLRSTWHALRHRGLILTLGSNTGVLSYAFRIRGRRCLMNMDGMEWKREKWSRLQRLWLWVNERAGARASTHLIADNPEISRVLQKHTSAARISMIPYGADCIKSASSHSLDQYGLDPHSYYLVVARPEPENSLLEIVKGHAESGSGAPLVLLGKYDPKEKPYHRRIVDAAGAQVRFLGAIYDRVTVQALRFYSRAYIHGHRVGGTNPSLVESLGSGCAVIAHNNPFNRWVAGPSAAYFDSPSELAGILRRLDSEPMILSAMREGSYARHRDDFTQERIMRAYEDLLSRFASEIPSAGKPSAREQDTRDESLSEVI